MLLGGGLLPCPDDFVSCRGKRAGQLPRARAEIARSLDVYPDENTSLLLQFSRQPNAKRSTVIQDIEAL